MRNNIEAEHLESAFSGEICGWEDVIDDAGAYLQ